MNYFQAYLPSLDEAIVAAWDSQVAESAETPWLADILATRSADIMPRFSACYAQLRKLPRGARRVLQRQLARSGESAIPLEWRQKLAGSLAGAALLLALGQGTAQALSITVNTTNPAINGTDNKCSLIEAIQNANETTLTPPHSNCDPGDPAGADTIKLPAGTITLTSSFVNIYGSDTGLPLITSAITIEGRGGRIVRKPTDPDLFRILAVGAGGDLKLERVTLSGGRSADSGGAVYNNGSLSLENSTISGNSAVNYGGGICNAAGKTLEIQTSKILKNAAGSGGGIYSRLNGVATIEDSTISTNSASDRGGGVYNGVGATMTIERTTITRNKAGNLGGGIINLSATSFTIENSTISSNSAGYVGGGILNEPGATATIEYCTVTRNTAYDSGGGIFNNNTITIENSTISFNRALTGGGGGFFNNPYAVATIEGVTFSKNNANDGGGIFNNVDGIITVDNSTLTGNTADAGGGVFNRAGTMTVDNSTISGNKANQAGGGIFNGYYFNTGNATAYFATITITNSTISGNTAKSAYGGGGLYNDYNVTMTVNNSTIAGNRATLFGGGGINNDGILDLNLTLISGNKAPTGREVYNYVNGTITGNNYNLFGVSGNDGIDYAPGANFAPGLTDIVPTVPLGRIIGPLKLNLPGTTKTRALPVGSPAIDQVPSGNLSCTSSPSNDQRGEPRPDAGGGGCDIGAFEKQ